MAINVEATACYIHSYITADDVHVELEAMERNEYNNIANFIDVRCLLLVANVLF